MKQFFSQMILQQQLNGRAFAAIKEGVDEMPENKFHASSDQQLFDYVFASHEVKPIVLLEDKITMSNLNDIVENIHKNPDVGIPHDHDGTDYVNATHIDINIPYTGDRWIFDCKPNPCPESIPEINIIYRERLVIFTLIKKHDTSPEEFKAIYMEKLELLRQVLKCSKEQVDAYNERIKVAIKKAIKARRKRLAKHEDIKNILNIPLAVNPDAPPIEPIKLEVQHIPPLPNAPKAGTKSERVIKDEDYEIILRCIRHMGRTFEQTPSTFKTLWEADLRNIILASLNMYFLGGATGETFRNRGKTDIRIEAEDRSAFIGECKMWGGSEGISAALDQLLGYTIWRDSKAALIVFNKDTADFSGVRDKIPTALQGHPLFIEALPCTEQGEWRVKMRSREDEGRRVTVHVFAFNLHFDKD